jgi:hypothetical protein
MGDKDLIKTKITISKILLAVLKIRRLLMKADALSNSTLSAGAKVNIGMRHDYFLIVNTVKKVLAYNSKL